MTTPDGWIRYYYEKRDNAGASAFNLVDSTGRVFAGACDKCGKRRKQTPTLEWECANFKCKAPWPYKPAYVLRGVVQTSLKPDHGEARLSRYLDVARELGRFLEEQGTAGRIYVAAALGHSRMEILERGPRAWPGDAFPWTEWNVRKAIREGREAWETKLRRIQLA